MPYYLCDMVTDPLGIPDSGPDGSGRLPRIAVNLGLRTVNAVTCIDVPWCIMWSPSVVSETQTIVLLDTGTYGGLTNQRRNRFNAFCDDQGIPRGWITSSTPLLTIALWLCRYIQGYYRLTGNGVRSIRANLTQPWSNIPANVQSEAVRWFGNLGVNTAAWASNTTLATILEDIATNAVRWRVMFGGVKL